MKDKNSLPYEGKKFPRYFAGCLEFFAVFQKFFLFIPRSLAEPQRRSAEPCLEYTVKFVKVFHDKIEAASLTTDYIVADGEVTETMLGVGKHIQEGLFSGTFCSSF